MWFCSLIVSFNVFQLCILCNHVDHTRALILINDFSCFVSCACGFHYHIKTKSKETTIFPLPPNFYNPYVSLKKYFSKHIRSSGPSLKNNSPKSYLSQEPLATPPPKKKKKTKPEKQQKIEMTRKATTTVSHVRVVFCLVPKLLRGAKDGRGALCLAVYRGKMSEGGIHSHGKVFIPLKPNDKRPETYSQKVVEILDFSFFGCVSCWAGLLFKNKAVSGLSQSCES